MIGTVTLFCGAVVDVSVTTDDSIFFKKPNTAVLQAENGQRLELTGKNASESLLNLIGRSIIIKEEFKEKEVGNDYIIQNNVITIADY